MTLFLEHGLIVSLVRGEVPKVHAPFHVYHLWAGRFQKWTLRMQLSRCCVYMHYQCVITIVVEIMTNIEIGLSKILEK